MNPARDNVLDRRRAAVRVVQRRQLIEGLAAAVCAKGFAAATITDIVRHARTSKTTFYEHFADKEAVALALHESVRAAVETAVADAVARTRGAPLPERVEAVITAYLRSLTEDPARLVQLQAQAQVVTPATVSAQWKSRGSLAALITQALTAPGEARRSEVAVRLMLSGTTELVAETVGSVPSASGAEGHAAADAVLALRPDLVDVWLKLLSGPAQPARSAAQTQSPPTPVSTPTPVPAPPAPPTRPPRTPTWDWRPGM